MTKYLDGYSSKAIKKFLKYQKDNPQVYDHFLKMAKQIKKTGRERYSARTIFEVLRWHLDVETNGENFKISNDFIPMFVRQLISEKPEFEDFFTLKGKVR